MNKQEFLTLIEQGEATLDNIVIKGKIQKITCDCTKIDLTAEPPNCLYPPIPLDTIYPTLFTNSDFETFTQNIKTLSAQADDFYRKAQRIVQGVLTDKNTFRVVEIPDDIKKTFSPEELQTLLNDEHTIEFVDCSHTSCKSPAVFTLKLEDKIYEPYWDNYNKKPYYKPDLFLVDIIGKNLQNDYLALKLRHEWDINHFPFFFAFDKQQFEEAIKKAGIQKDEKIISFSAGIYLRENEKDNYHRMIERHRQERKAAIESDTTGNGYIYQMFKYELANHEYGYTGDTSDTLQALGLTEEEIIKNKALMHGYKKALKEYKF